MGQLLVVAVSKATFILVACATLALLSVSGCGIPKPTRKDMRMPFIMFRI